MTKFTIGYLGSDARKLSFINYRDDENLHFLGVVIFGFLFEINKYW